MKSHFDHKTGKTTYSLTAYERRCVTVAQALCEQFRPHDSDLMDGAVAGLGAILTLTAEKQEAGTK